MDRDALCRRGTRCGLALTRVGRRSGGKLAAVPGFVLLAACAAVSGEGDMQANERAAAAGCKAFAEAEEIYHRTDYDADGVLEYAQTLHGGRRAVARTVDPAALPKPSEEERQTAAKLIKDLASDEFAVRERASEGLTKLGPKAFVQLQAAEKAETDAEVLHRCRKLCQEITAALAPAPVGDLQHGLYTRGVNAGMEGDLCLIDRTFAKAEWPLGSDGSTAVPKNGYFFRVLPKQGAAATGGARNYVIGANMVLGYALLAFPKEYGVTGQRCFMINNNGTIFERDFGGKEQTEAFAKACAEFNPTRDWKVTE